VNLSLADALQLTAYFTEYLRSRWLTHTIQRRDRKGAAAHQEKIAVNLEFEIGSLKMLPCASK